MFTESRTIITNALLKRLAAAKRPQTSRTRVGVLILFFEGKTQEAFFSAEIVVLVIVAIPVNSRKLMFSVHVSVLLIGGRF